MSAGSAKIDATDAVSVLHSMSGMRLSDMPGARIVKIVTTKLIAPAVVEIVRNSSASA